MSNMLAKAAFLLCICWLAAISTAAAQTLRPFDRPATGRYQVLDSRPTVSPYVNLANNNGGLSNYQTLVRPLIEEREELNRQWTALEQLNQQIHGTASTGNGAETARGVSSSRSSSLRFMHYSHYFGTNH